MRIGAQCATIAFPAEDRSGQRRVQNRSAQWYLQPGTVDAAALFRLTHDTAAARLDEGARSLGVLSPEYRKRNPTTFSGIGMDRDSSSSVRVIGIAGSLRAGSLNRMLLEAARELAPEGMAVEIFDLNDIPLYNADLDNDERRPEEVQRLKQAISEADALLIATPEYNHTVPGVLQNTIDWVSRPGMKSPLAGKPVAIMGASPGAVGTARAQQQLKLVLLSTLALLLPHPGVLVAKAREKFGPDGELTDAPTREFLAGFLRDLQQWVTRLSRPADAEAGT